MLGRGGLLPRLPARVPTRQVRPRSTGAKQLLDLSTSAFIILSLLSCAFLLLFSKVRTALPQSNAPTTRAVPHARFTSVPLNHSLR